jgi:hypothetical protein
MTPWLNFYEDSLFLRKLKEIKNIDLGFMKENRKKDHKKEVN